MAPDSDELTTRIHELDKKHQLDSYQIDLVKRDEESRRLKVRALSLRDENATLKDQLRSLDARLLDRTRQSEEAQVELVEMKQLAQNRLDELEKKDMKLQNLQAEKESRDNSLKSSDQVRKEKMEVDMELKRIKPQFERLERQIKGYEKVVAEKQALEKELVSVTAQLEDQRRTKQTSQQPEDTTTNEEWKAKVENLAAELAQERGERERGQKAHERELHEVSGKFKVLEERLKTTSFSLKAAKAELKKVNGELEECRAQLKVEQKASQAAERPSKAIAAKLAPGKKRRGNDTSIDDMTTIGTPGEATFLKRPTKKRGFDHLLTEKSTFSITPYLSKTKEVSDDSLLPPSPTAARKSAEPEPSLEGSQAEPEAQEAEEAQARSELTEDSQELQSESDKPAPKARGRPKGKTLGDAPAKKDIPTSSRKGKGLTVKKETKLARVAEESEASEQENSQQPKAKKAQEAKPKAAGGTASLKRRKLGGTLFDDAREEEEIAGPVKSAGSRKTKTKLGTLGSLSSVGGSFSPRKKDKRGGHTSFLA